MRTRSRGLVLALGASVVAVPSVLAGRTAAGESPTTEAARPPFSPAPANCFSLSGYGLRVPRLTDAVHLSGDGRATIAWITPTGVVMSASQVGSGAWGTPQAVAGSTPVDSRAPMLAGNAAGDLALAWVRKERVQVALLPARGPWGPPRTVSRASQTVLPYGPIPLMTVDTGGRVTLAWPSVGRSHVRRLGGGGFAIKGALHAELALGTVTGGVRPARALDLDPARFDAQTLGFGTDARGRPVLASSRGGRVAVADIDPARGAPLPATERRLIARPPRGPAGLGGSYSQPVIARGTDGRMALAWTSNGVVTVAVRSPTGVWRRAVAVSRPSLDAGERRIAIGTDGRIAVAWIAVVRTPRPGRPGHRSRVVVTALRSAAGVWEAPQRLTTPSQNPNDPQISIDGRGKATLVVALGTNGISGRASSVRYATRGPSDATWARGGALSSAGLGPLFPRLATNAAGDAVAVWSRCLSRTAATVEVTTRPAGASSWSPVTRFGVP